MESIKLEDSESGEVLYGLICTHREMKLLNSFNYLISEIDGKGGKSLYTKEIFSLYNALSTLLESTDKYELFNLNSEKFEKLSNVSVGVRDKS